MGRGVDIPWIGNSIYHGKECQTAMSKGVKYTMGSGVDIPWVGWGRYATDRLSKYHG